MATIWCNGEWRVSESPAASWTDRGLLHGLGLFETLLAVDGRPMHVDLHLLRLQSGCERLGWSMPHQDLKSAMTELLARNGLHTGRSRIRLAVTAGSGPLNDLNAGSDRLCWMTAEPLAKGPGAVRLGLSLWRRNEHSPLTGLKCASYAENLVALDWARSEGYDELLFLNTRGDLCEAATANVFLVINGRLYTPGRDSGCLPGVTRALVIDLAKGLGLTVSEESLQLDDVMKADECFLTSATRGVVPVAAFEGKAFGNSPVATQLANYWQDLLSSR